MKVREGVKLLEMSGEVQLVRFHERNGALVCAWWVFKY